MDARDLWYQSTRNGAWDRIGAVLDVRPHTFGLGTFLDGRESSLLFGQHDSFPLGGTLLFIDRSFLVYASMAVYLVTVICVVLLRETSG